MRRVLLLALLAVATVASGCDSAAPPPESRSMAGRWDGTITHPNPDFSGALSLSVTQVGDALGGSVTWRSGSSTTSGTLLGTLPERGPVTATFQLGGRRSSNTFIEGTLSGDRLSGTWESQTGITGTFSVSRD